MPYFLKLSAESEAIEFLSIGEVAALAKRKKVSLLKLTYRGILPEANFRTPKCEIKKGLKKGEFIEGYRLYSKKFLVPKLVSFLKKEISQGKKITLEQRHLLLEMFQEERDYYLT